MFDPSSFANPTPLAHADTSRDVLPRGGTSQCAFFWGALPEIARNWLRRHRIMARACMGLGSRVDIMSHDGARLGAEEIKYIRRFQIHQFRYTECSTSSSRS
ncbi:hypothetical protein TNCV_716211 [Trichonephila clavipes]|nr:hypothetical protein TNCV_716211 [Trichonephila clavipes]